VGLSIGVGSRVLQRRKRQLVAVNRVTHVPAFDQQQFPVLLHATQSEMDSQTSA